MTAFGQGSFGQAQFGCGAIEELEFAVAGGNLMMGSAAMTKEVVQLIIAHDRISRQGPLMLR